MDVQEIRKTLEVFKKDMLVEARSFGKGKSATTSGYFVDFDNLIKHIQRFKDETYYFVMNEIKQDCYSREQNEKIIAGPKATTSDNDILKRRWVLIDADPKRASGVSATDAEKAHAKTTILKVYNYLRDVGFAFPVVADSGNGYHLLYSVSMDNIPIVTDLIKKFLQALDMLFTDEHVSIDTAVFNASRITKLYGTIARKGSNTQDRPHRPSRILKIPDEIKPTSKDLFQKVADLLPALESPSYKNNFSSQFDIRDFISRHGIRVSSEYAHSNGTKFVLESCVFDTSHKSPDAAIFLMNSGAIGYKCFHNSCSGYSWQDVRLKFEPNAYNKAESPRTNKPVPSQSAPQRDVPPEVVQEKGPRFLRLKDIEDVDRSKIVSIRSGLHALDKKIIGFNKGEFTIWSGGNGSGKSTMLSQLALESINDGFKVVMFSGELTSSRAKYWLRLQAAGRQFNKPTGYDNVYYTPKSIGAEIDAWTGDKLWIYNNNYGLDADTVIPDVEKHAAEHKADVIIIDNLMSLDLTRIMGDKYDKQSILVLKLADIAKKLNAHIHFVCHPRKANGFLRKADISGTSDITNAADNVIMMHRQNKDFEDNAKNFFGVKKASRYSCYSNVLEVMKNRDLGVQDELIGLYFEAESKRLLNEPYENKSYNWRETPFFTDENISDYDNPFLGEV